MFRAVGGAALRILPRLGAQSGAFPSAISILTQPVHLRGHSFTSGNLREFNGPSHDELPIETVEQVRPLAPLLS